MTASSTSQKERGSSKERVVRCPKCRTVNDSGRKTCESCGAHLHISCRDCGERNERSASRCKACGRRLHRSAFRKLFTQRFGRTVKVTPLQVLLLIIAVAIGYKMIVMFSESMSQTGGGGDSVSIHSIWRA